MSKNYKLTVGKMGEKLKTVHECKELYVTLAPLIASVAKCLKDNSLKMGEFVFNKDDERLKLKFLNDERGSGEILVEVAGIKDDSLGLPYYSSWDGLFYRLPSQKKKPFVKSGQFVKNGQPIGIVYINKNEQFILNSPSDGFVYFAQGDEYLERGILINVFNKDNMENNEPMFYLK